MEESVRGVHQGSGYTGILIYVCHQGQHLLRPLASYYMLKQHTSPNICSDEHATQPDISRVLKTRYCFKHLHIALTTGGQGHQIQDTAEL